jgi:hypothetical protein
MNKHIYPALPLIDHTGLKISVQNMDDVDSSQMKVLADIGKNLAKPIL